MSNEVRELKDHVQWLERELGTSDHIEEQLDEIKEEISDVQGRINSVCDAIITHNDILRKLVDVIPTLGDIVVNAINKVQAGAAEQQAAQSPLSELLSDRPKQPKRQKFKPKVVDKDQPGGTAS